MTPDEYRKIIKSIEIIYNTAGTIFESAQEIMDMSALLVFAQQDSADM